MDAIPFSWHEPLSGIAYSVARVSYNHLLIKFLRVRASPRPPKFRSPEAGAPTSLCVSPNDKSSAEHDMTETKRQGDKDNNLKLQIPKSPLPRQHYFSDS